ncbi:MAG: GNAT family N-acetyltransferase, partial [Acidobacteriaceae bacterium]|nr:GNAT family N-acetyltransferase [Acidobacteriaceae bacterium]
MMTSLALQTRKASMRDIPNILALINSYAAKGIMLPRTEFEMSENIRDFSVAYDGEILAGCGALHFYTPTSAEVRSLAVLPQMKQHGIGRAIVDALEQ